MKLEELRINGSFSGQSIQLGRFADGMTFVYSENSSDRNLTSDLVRHILTGQRDPNSLPSGQLVGSRKGLRLQLQRPDAGTNQLVLNQLHPYEHNASLISGGVSSSILPTEQDLISRVTTDLYDTVFNVNLKQTLLNAPRLARVLRDRFQIGYGSAFAGDDAIHLARQRELESAKLRMAALQQKIDDLQRQRTNAQHELTASQAQWQQELAAMDATISGLRVRLNELHTQSVSDELTRLNTEIEALRLRIESAKTEVIYPTTADSSLDDLQSLYLRLDEIDNQIHRWRHVQSDIHNQRLRLRDEMLVWNELTLDSDEHPYHVAREILVGLESKVDQAERNAGHWATAGGARVDAEQMAKTLGQLCQSMRDDLYGLCNELSHQFKHLRHKAAAAELKQLRRCYTEMGENIDRLVRRRAVVVREIREQDPAGADAIVRANNDFCQCAQHEGYLAARKRFVGDQLQAKAKPVRIEPDLSHERRRLIELENRRNELILVHGNTDGEIAELNRKLALLNHQREEMLSRLNSSNGPSLEAIDAELNQLYAQMSGLKERDDLTVTTVVANPLLKEASSFLRQLTDGQLIRVFLEEQAGNLEPRWIIHDQHAKSRTLAELDPDRQDQAYVALIMAAKIALHQQGVELPTLINDAFSRIAGERVTPTLQLLNGLGQQGHQIVVLSQHRYLADRIPGVPVLSINETPAPASTPVVKVRSVSPAVIRYGDTAWAENQLDEVLLESRTPVTATWDDEPARPYPLSKYSRNDQESPEIYSLPPTTTSNRAAPNSSYHSNYAPVPIERIGEPIDLIPRVNETTLLDQTGLFDAAQLRRFADHGLSIVQHLMEIDPAYEELGIGADQVDRFQDQLWLMMTVPTLRPEDACALVACGISEPEQLATSHAQNIYERITRFLNTTRARHSFWTSVTIGLDRIERWLDGLDQTRSQWRNRQRRARRPRYRENTLRDRGERSQGRSSESQDWDQSRRSNRRDDTDRQVRTRAIRSADRDVREDRQQSRAPRTPRPPRMHSAGPVRTNDRDFAPRVEREDSRRERTYTPRQARASVAQERDARSKPKTERKTRSSASTKSSKSAKGLKFYLDLTDHIEAAPSIGPKTAERFEKIGVVTVADFLKQTAESMAEKLNYKRLNAEVLRQWQHQARLVCRIPNLRGHDAQLLVACDVIEPEELATMQPQVLFDVIGPFSDSKEGLKIIRNGKKPDLEEITDWITWAGETRSIQAA